jgi:hypothetical protein
MRNLFAILTLVFGSYAYAGAQSDIPFELIDLDNQGRAIFVRNSLSKIGVPTGSYERLVSVIIGGESTIQEEEKGAYIGYSARVHTSVGSFNCEERLVLGSFIRTRPDLIGNFPVECTPIR